MIPPIASRFVAGESVASALDHIREANADGIAVILNLLGEHYDDRRTADADAARYVELADELAATDLDACLSVKPSQLGLDVGESVFVENYRRIVDHAASKDVFVWCDMEDATTTDVTIEAFVDAAEDHEWQVGLCVQSNLRRTAADLERLVDVPGKLRLVKGAYDEDGSIAYSDRETVNERYRADLEYAFSNRDRGVSVASHDPEMIDYAKQLHNRYGTAFEIQMLMGVREAAQRDLADAGYDVYQYAPFGGRWMSYFYRRIRERKENVLFALRAIVGR
ncbi:MAG: proline dehydrogenase family protein [Halobacteriota archaeon]